MNFAVLDLETNGFKGKSVVSASSIVFDEDGKILDFFNRYYFPSEKPDGGAIKVHGLTPSRISLLRRGSSYPEYFADDCHSLSLFWEYCRVDGITVHNLGFDSSFLPQSSKKRWKWWCSMIGLTDFCRIPGRRGRYKWPKLDEAKKIMLSAFSGSEDTEKAEREISGQICHNSLSDCFDLYSIFIRVWQNRPDLVKFRPVRDTFVKAAEWSPMEWSPECGADDHVRSFLQYSLSIARIAGLHKKEAHILSRMEELFPES
jgi:DNA polymerase III epsilon subunit-like protein